TGLEFAGRSAGGLLPHGGRLRLVELVGGLSDPHRGGRGVWKLWFVDPAAAADAAGPQRFGVVYKPRSLAVDAHFQALLGFCNRGARCGALHLANLRHARWTPGDPAFPELRVLRLLDRGDHGWVELVQREDCADAAAAARFYLRQGAYLALLHVLDAADLHYENVIAAGEQPALVDLETLFHPWIAGDAEAAPRDAAGRAAARLRGSVIRTALLPGRAWGDRERAGVNVGGLGDGRAQLSPRAALDWAHAGTDAMHATERRFAVPPGDNVPRAGGQAAPVAHHVEPLVAGFEAMLRFLIGERDALLGPGGAIRRFAGDPMRRLLRATSAYSHLLEAASHPDHLRDALDRERLFDLLWTASLGVPHLLRAVGHERRDLCDGDVPYFTARPGSCDLWDSRGEPIAGLFAEPPLATAAARLAALGPDDLAAQVFVIRAAVSAASIASAAPDRAAAPLAARGRTPLDAARAIGELLEATAITGERDATWLGMNAARDGAGVELGPVGGGLYDGTGGIALFLGWLGRLTGEARFTRLARRAAEATRGAVAVDDEPGGLVGAPSQLYALAQLAALWDEPALVPPLHPILARIAARIAAGASFDVVHGAAGCILALLAVHELTGDDQILPVVATAGRAVLAGALREGPGAAWPCTVAARPLLGFSHGAAGIAAALLRLAGVAARRPEIDLDPEPLVALARAGFNFERGQLDAAAGNWPDLRDPPAGAGAAPRFLLAYCH
ncbi:MAG TPA: type 2 lanthipeptide synthetase LanM, partial [Kofleriaceae bacterium]|nr:type 2 lanthipeptide synthetase LanM [Kofleriaceae bacterium]